MLVIKNGEDSQTLKFGYLCLKALQEKWALPGIQSTINKVVQTIAYFVTTDVDGEVVVNEVEDISSDVIDVFVDILEASTGNEDFNGTHFGDWIFSNMDQLGLVMTEFFKSLPQEKKPIAPKK